MGFGEELRGLQSLYKTFPEKKKKKQGGNNKRIGVIGLFIWD